MAVEKILMPQLGESVTEGTIEKWLVEVGDTVNKYDPIAEVNTDKVNAEVPSSFTGVIKELVAAEGDTIEVGELVCYIDIEGGASEEKQEESTAQKAIENISEDKKDQEEVDQPMKRRYSPAVLRMAQENNLDLEQISGSGKGGRITRKDIQKVIESGEMPAPKEEPKAVSKKEEKKEAPKAPVKETSEGKGADVPVAEGDIEIPVTGVRRAIANNMLRSKHEAPHAWTMIEVDVTNLVEYRNGIKDDFKKKEGYGLTFFAFFVKAVVEALKEFPQMNSMWAGDKIVQKKDINISIAVGTDESLFVPVIKNADEKSIKGIAREVKELAQKAKTGKLKGEEMQGGTFTVNNTGSFGSVQSMGIINYPQAAILQVESIVKRPVVMNNGMIAVRDMVNLCLSLDHRVLDGMICGKFLARVKENLETISKDNTSVY
ncbi:dihydrolipoamide acetyltransferase family protein [Guptibacillus hwajinpoensis]|uniref:dihydrolipoamide acetyltransferase family protein n=1 Tax=Guptibacillus hwajinpoensis TaxID=208199 RepID=UPI001CFE1656|nr:dihydrolipoamide acetyltransferase family protein [Pseudalkalibacillus hwajinpoensis]WLR60444.1 dihydrolipoamide acetyltransferase family protein [Pseudalkalibacillus hwajinpoensis]